jgi:hypothetical protein
VTSAVLGFLAARLGAVGALAFRVVAVARTLAKEPVAAALRAAPGLKLVRVMADRAEVGVHGWTSPW